MVGSPPPAGTRPIRTPATPPPLLPASQRVDGDPPSVPAGALDTKWLWNKANEIADMEGAAALRKWFDDGLSKEAKAD